MSRISEKAIGMFNIVQVKGDDAGGYYGTQANYYLGGEAPSNWVGQGAAAIGLKGPVDPAAFTQLMNGEVPKPGSDPVRVLSGVRKGWDMTISAPKWASVLITLGEDKRLAAHWQTAAKRAFDYVERFATYRETVKGVTRDVVGARLIGGAFLHDANRNNEPSIHVHMVASAIGVTKRGKLRAVDLQHAYKHAKLIGQYVHANFAHTARRDGYQVGLDDKGMAVLENAPEGLGAVSEALSTRRDEVRSEIDRLGVATRQGEVAVVRATREAKSPDTADLITHAKAVAEAKGFGPDQIRALVPDTHLSLKDAMAARVDGALPGFVAKTLAEQSGKTPGEPSSTPPGDAPGFAKRLVRLAGAAITEIWAQLSDQSRSTDKYARTGYPAPQLSDSRPRPDVFRPPEDYPATRLAARHELAYQIRRVSERQAAFTLHDVVLPTLISGLNEDLPGVTETQVLGAARDFVSEGLLVVGRDRKSLYTATGLELEREQRIHEHTERGKGQSVPVLAPDPAQRAIHAYEADAHKLTDGQRQLVTAILSSKDRFVSVQGVAGTGKTTALRAAQSILKSNTKATGHVRLYGVANTKSARDEVRAQGIEARTTASFLSRFTRYFHTGVLPTGEDKADWENTVLLFDEASFAGNADMEAAMAIADKLGVRGFVAQGDRDQLPAIPAGNVPDLISKLSHGFTVTLSDIVRQTNPDLREAIEQLVGAKPVSGAPNTYKPIGGPRDVTTRLSKAVAAWTKADAITDLGLERARDKDSRAEQLQAIAASVAGKWQALSPQERAETLVVFPTHELRALFHDEVRQTLRQEGEIIGEDKDLQVLRPKPMGQAEKDRAGNYSSGDVLVFSQMVRRIWARPGARFSVDQVDRDANQLALRDTKGEPHTLSLSDGRSKLPRFEVFRETSAAFAIGDRIRILPGDPRNLADGLTDLTITGEDGRGLEVTGRVSEPGEDTAGETRTLRLQAGSTTAMMIDHDYSRTVYAAQGLSALRVLAGFHSQSIMTSFANLYVIGSRAKEALSIITDSLERAMDAVAHNPGIQMSAHTAMDHLEVEHFIDRARTEMDAARQHANPDFDESPAEPDMGARVREDRAEGTPGGGASETPMSEERPADLDRDHELELEDEVTLDPQPDREVGD